MCESPSAEAGTQIVHAVYRQFWFPAFAGMSGVEARGLTSSARPGEGVAARLVTPPPPPSRRRHARMSGKTQARLG
jgi:hypothetical protein